MMGYTLKEAAVELGVKYSTLKTWAWHTDAEFTHSKNTIGEPVEYEGKVTTLANLAKQHGILRDTLSCRLRNGWGLDKALNTPVKYRREVAHSEGRDKSTEGLDLGRMWLRGYLK